MELQETIERLQDMRQALKPNGKSNQTLSSAIKHLKTIPDLQQRLINMVNVKEDN